MKGIQKQNYYASSPPNKPSASYYPVLNQIIASRLTKLDGIARGEMAGNYILKFSS